MRLCKRGIYFNFFGLDFYFVFRFCIFLGKRNDLKVIFYEVQILLQLRLDSRVCCEDCFGGFCSNLDISVDK